MDSTEHAAEKQTRSILEAAARFHSEHKEEAGIGDTFGYFTDHPVAGLNRRRLQAILSRLEQRRRELGRPLRILDVACGGGLITGAAAAGGNTVFGIDLSDGEISLAQRFNATTPPPEGGTVRFASGNVIDDADWEKLAEQHLQGKPDAIILAYALHHLPKVDRFCERVGKWLDPGALLVINEENPKAPMFRLKHQVRTWIQKDTEEEWHRTYSRWKELLEPCGFRVGDPVGLDPLPGLGSLFPLRCWSLVFSARKEEGNEGLRGGNA